MGCIEALSCRQGRAWPGRVQTPIDRSRGAGGSQPGGLNEGLS